MKLFFSILGRRLLKRGEFERVDELVNRIAGFITDHTRTAKPFECTDQGKPLKAT